MASLTFLNLLDISNNPHLSGSIPTGFSLLNNLYQLFLYGDSLAGAVPALSHVLVDCVLQVSTSPGNCIVKERVG